MSIIDEKKADLEALGYLGSLNDMEDEWLTALGCTTGNLTDKWKCYLEGEGYSGALDDMMLAWLGTKGYSGSLIDRIKTALEADDFYLVGYVAAATKFDGTNDYIQHASELTGATDGQQFLLSCWINSNGGDTSTQYYFDVPGDRITFRKLSDSLAYIVLKDTAGSTLINMASTNTILASGGWYHVLASIDTSVAGSGYMFINDAQEFNGSAASATNIDFTNTLNTIGATDTGASKANACISEFYMTNEYLDLSVEANRRKFIDASGKPVNLGADGSTPTGTQPLIYLPNPFGTFETNAGSGGNFTVTGALEACASSPSD